MYSDEEAPPLPPMPPMPPMPTLPNLSEAHTNITPLTQTISPPPHLTVTDNTQGENTTTAHTLLPALSVSKPDPVPVRDSIIFGASDTLTVEHARQVSVKTDTSSPGSRSPTLISTRKFSNASLTGRPSDLNEFKQPSPVIAPEPRLVLPSQNHKSARHHSIDDTADSQSVKYEPAKDFQNMNDNLPISGPLQVETVISQPTISPLANFNNNSEPTSSPEVSKVYPESPLPKSAKPAVGQAEPNYIVPKSGPSDHGPSNSVTFTASQFDSYMENITKRAQRVNNEIVEVPASSSIKSSTLLPEAVNLNGESGVDHPIKGSIPESVPPSIEINDTLSDVSYEVGAEKVHVAEHNESYDDNSFDDDIYGYYADSANDDEDIYNSSLDNKGTSTVNEPSATLVSSLPGVTPPNRTLSNSTFTEPASVDDALEKSNVVENMQHMNLETTPLSSTKSPSLPPVTVPSSYESRPDAQYIDDRTTNPTAPLAKASPFQATSFGSGLSQVPSHHLDSSSASENPAHIDSLTHEPRHIFEENVEAGLSGSIPWKTPSDNFAEPTVPSTSLETRSYETVTAPLVKSPRITPPPFGSMTDKKISPPATSFTSEPANPINETPSYGRWRPISTIVPPDSSPDDSSPSSPTKPSNITNSANNSAVPFINIQSPGHEYSDHSEPSETGKSSTQQTALEKDIMKSFGANRMKPPAPILAPASSSTHSDLLRSAGDYSTPDSPAVPDPEIAALYHNTTHFLARPISQIGDVFPATQPLSPQRSREPSYALSEVREDKDFANAETEETSHNLKPVSTSSSWETHVSVPGRVKQPDDDSIAMPKNPARTPAQAQSPSMSSLSDMSPTISKIESKGDGESLKFKSLLLDDDEKLEPSQTNASALSNPPNYEYLARHGTTATTIVKPTTFKSTAEKLHRPPAFDFRAILTKPRSEDRKTAFDNARLKEVDYDCGLQTWLQQVSVQADTKSIRPNGVVAARAVGPLRSHARAPSGSFAKAASFTNSIKPSALKPSALKQGIAGKLNISRVGEKSSSAAKGLFARGRKFIKSDK